MRDSGEDEDRDRVVRVLIRVENDSSDIDRGRGDESLIAIKDEDIMADV